MIAKAFPCCFLGLVEQALTEENALDDLETKLDQFSEYLRKEGMKITSQRLLVAERIFCSNHHFTVEGLTDELKSTHRGRISKATVYRIVSLLVEAGMLTEHHFGQNSRRYEHIPRHKHHDHILCLDCGQIDEFVDPKIEKLQLQIAEKLGYTLEDHSLTLYGRCQKRNCPNKKTKNKS